MKKDTICIRERVYKKTNNVLTYQTLRTLIYLCFIGNKLLPYYAMMRALDDCEREELTAGEAYAFVNKQFLTYKNNQMTR